MQPNKRRKVFYFLFIQYLSDKKGCQRLFTAVALLQRADEPWLSCCEAVAPLRRAEVHKFKYSMMEGGRTGTVAR